MTVFPRILAYSLGDAPLGRGFLTGAFNSKADFAAGESVVSPSDNLVLILF